MDEARKLAESEADALRNKLLVLEQGDSATQLLPNVVQRPSQNLKDADAIDSQEGVDAGRGMVPGDRVRVLEGELVEVNGRVNEVKKMWKNAEESRKRQEEEANARIEADAEKLRELAAELNDAKEHHLKLEQEKESALIEREKIKEDFNALQQEHAALQQGRASASAEGGDSGEAAALEELQKAQHALDRAQSEAKEQQENAESAALEAQKQRQHLENQLEQAEAQILDMKQQLEDSYAKAKNAVEAEDQVRKIQEQVQAAKFALEESRSERVALEARAAFLQQKVEAAERHADENASKIEAELTSKISELNEKCARFYQDREDARESLSDASASTMAYKKTLIAVIAALKSPVMMGREVNVTPEDLRNAKLMFSGPTGESGKVKDVEGALVSLLMEEVEQGVVEAMELVASRSNSWQEARRGLEADLLKGEKRARNIQEKLDAKQKEVINLLEALKNAEQNAASHAAKSESKRREPDLSARGLDSLPKVLHRVWADNVGWALLSGMGADGEADWYCESAVRTSFSAIDAVAKYEEALERAGVLVVLEEMPMRENKIAELTGDVEKKQQELVALQEEYRAYKIKAHTVLRKKEVAAPERDEDAEAARRRAEVQAAVEKEREKLSARVKEAQGAADAAKEDAAAAQRKFEDAEKEVQVKLKQVQFLEEKVGVLEDQIRSAAQRERERDVEVLKEKEQQEQQRQLDREEWEKEIERERGRERKMHDASLDATGDGVEKSEAVQVLRRRVASLEQEIQSAQLEQQSALRALEASKEKAQAMLLDKDGVISSLRARLKSGLGGGDAIYASDMGPGGEKVSNMTRGEGGHEAGQAELVEPNYDAMFHEQKNEDDKFVGRQLYFAPLERASVERKPSAEMQEDHILHVAQMQAQQSEFVSSLQEKISILKDNVSEGKRLQDLLCKERDQLREALEVMKREADTTKRLERYSSKFREGTNIEYLKNVLLKYIETQDHEGLIPVLSSVLEFDADEQRRLHAAQSRMSSPWSKLGTKLGGGLF